MREDVQRLKELNIMDTSKILLERKLSSSIVSAGLCIGVNPKVLEYYMPMLLDATNKINEEIKTQRNRESLLEGNISKEESR